MMGLSDAGKTTILYRLKLTDCVNTIPTAHFNVEEIRHRKTDITLWDLSIGGAQERAIWRHYLQNTDGFIFVVDSSVHDPSVHASAREELRYLLEEREELKDLPLLVYANKGDVHHSLTVAEVRDMLQLQTVTGERPWHIQGSCGTTGDGLGQGLDWLILNMGNDATTRAGPT
ncbi:hypothetical protein KVV02_007153 [Mortierella alpina]|uniref:ADP-ribosylation factor n=1 Tax=Mortierella alpina TaxID=64518 RepID=A0A9P8D0E9_MORAP|nr:hypothetical protein KVV02_007153 [Mortierella alpina]